MAIITISRGSYSRGGQVAELVAKRLGYQCIAREVLLEASDQYDIPEARLVRSVRNSPTILDRLSGGHRRYVSFIQAALLRHLRQDDAVYHGFAGHVFVADVDHVLKVRVIAEPEDRLETVVERDGVSRDEAARILDRDDAERRRWSLQLYGIDPTDPCLYDLVIHINKLTVDDAADLICNTVCLPQFKTTSASQQMIDDLALAAEVQAALMELTVDVEVTAVGGQVTITTVEQLTRVQTATSALQDKAMTVPGVASVQIVPGLLSRPPPDSRPPSGPHPLSSRRMIA